MEDWVFVDTCIWAAFFAKPASLEKQTVDSLIDADRVALVGPIVAEVLLGFRKKAQADWVASRLRHAHCLDLDWDDWRNAAALGRALAANGHKVPLTDLAVAVIAKRCNSYVYSTDSDFDVIQDLKRFSP